MLSIVKLVCLCFALWYRSSYNYYASCSFVCFYCIVIYSPLHYRVFIDFVCIQVKKEKLFGAICMSTHMHIREANSQGSHSTVV